MPLAQKDNMVLEYLQPSDANQIGPLTCLAFHTYPYFQHMMPANEATFTGWAESTLSALKDPHTIALKVTDGSTGKIIAHGRWIRPRSPDETSQPGHEEGRWTDSFMNACDGHLAGELFGAFDRNREKFMGDERHWYMELLLTHPEHQGKGAASMILKHGLELADQDGLPCYIDSSPKGKPLYERVGWKLGYSEDFEYDMKYYFGIRPARK